MEVAISGVNESIDNHDGLPAYWEHVDGPMIRVTVSLPNRGEKLPFDFARLRLQGAIKTQIGSRKSVEKFFNRVEECSWSQFAPMETTDDSMACGYSASVAFDEGEKAISMLASPASRPPPSTSVSGPYLMSKHTALRDQHFVQGRYETHCWVTADFYSNGAIIQSSQAPVDLDCSPRVFSLRARKSDGRTLPTITCQAPRKTLFHLRRSIRVQPTATIRLPEDSLIVYPVGASDDKKSSTTFIPLNVSLDNLSETDIDTILQEGGLACDVETKWISQTTFTAGAPYGVNLGPARVSRRSVSTHTSRVVFPPVHDAGVRNDSPTLSSTGTLELVRPESAILPTLSTCLLQVDYELEMRYRFHLECGRVLEGKLKTACILEN